MPSFKHQGRRLTYDVYGEGSRTLVLTHGLLMNRGMYQHLGPEMAERGNRVICLDLLGHGQSDRPNDVSEYSMPIFAQQVVALLDHLEIDEAVIGGTSLGANVALEVASIAPERVRGLFVEMPVLESALLAAALIFTPIMLTFQLGEPVMRGVSQLTRRIPRTLHLIDLGLDWIRQDPGPSGAVLKGLFAGEIAPHRSRRKTFEMPALMVGHPRDPLHPFTDAELLAKELPNGRLLDANSILEWRINPSRLNDELGAFLEECWAPKAKRAAPRKRRAAAS